MSSVDKNMAFSGSTYLFNQPTNQPINLGIKKKAIQRSHKEAPWLAKTELEGYIFFLLLYALPNPLAYKPK
jgi:hypothetical protein